MGYCRKLIVGLLLSSKVMIGGWLFRDLKYFPDAPPGMLRRLGHHLGGFEEHLHRALEELQHYPEQEYSGVDVLYMLLGENLITLNQVLVAIETNLNNDEELLKLKKLLVIFDIDQLIFFVLFHLQERELTSALEHSEVLRNWSTLSRGDDWTYFNQLNQAEPLDFADKFLRWAEKLNIGELFGDRLVRLANYSRGGNAEEIKQIKVEVFSKIKTKRDLAIACNLNERERRWLSHVENHKSLSPQIKNFTSLDHLLRGKIGYHAFMEKLRTKLASYQEEEKQCLPAQAIPAQARGFNPHPSNFLKKYSRALFSSLALPCITSLYVFFHLKRIKNLFNTSTCWARWEKLSFAELQTSQPEKVVSCVTPDILMRTHTKKIFSSNEKILNDFLHEIEYELSMLTYYCTWAKRMGPLGALMMLDQTIVRSADNWSKKLQLLQEKVAEYLLATKGMQGRVAAQERVLTRSQ